MTALGVVDGSSSRPSPTSPEHADEHSQGCCTVDCTHPDHFFDGPTDLDWLMFGQHARERDDDGPVML